MVSSVRATALCACILLLSLATAATQSTPPASPAAATTAANPPDPSADAAARHAKRTACLKQAKAKKLIGADRNAYIKDCLAH